MDAIPYVDELINEYLLFRGFIKSFSTFNAEKSVGGSGGGSSGGGSGSSGGGSGGGGGPGSSSGVVNIPADVDGLTELILGHVRALELVELLEVWATLRSKFFIHLDQAPGATAGTFEPLLKSMEMSLKKAVLVKAHTRRRMDKLRECYDRLQGEMLASSAAAAAAPTPAAAAGANAMSDPSVTPTAATANSSSLLSLASSTSSSSSSSIPPSGSWAGWFELPYVQDPAHHPLFAAYFHRRWFATLGASLRNFLGTLFRVLPLPRILAFNVEREKRRRQTAELRATRADLERTRAELLAATTQLGQLKSEGYRIFQQRSATQPTPAQAQAHAAINAATAAAAGVAPNANGAPSVTISEVQSPNQHAAVAWPETSAPSTSASSASSAAAAATSSVAAHEEADPLDFAVSSSSILSLTTPPRDAFALTATHLLLGHSGPVLRARFSTEGAWLATVATNAMEDGWGHATTTTTTTATGAGAGMASAAAAAASDERAQSKIWSLDGLLAASREHARRAMEAWEDRAQGHERDTTTLLEDGSFESTPKLISSSTLAFSDPMRGGGGGAMAGGRAGNPPPRKAAPAIRNGGGSGGGGNNAGGHHEDASSSSTSSYLTSSNDGDGGHEEDGDGGGDALTLRPSLTLSHSVPLSSLAFSKSDRYLLTGSGGDGRIGVWNLGGGGPSSGQPAKLLSSFFSGESALGSPCPVILDLVCSPGDRFLVSAAATKMHCECGNHDAETPSGQVASVAELQGVLEKFDLVTGKREFVFATSAASASSSAGGGGGAECSQVNSIALTQNGNMLVSGGADGILRVWDTRTSQAMIGWSAHALSAVSCLRLCADETTVLSAGLDGSMSEWSLHRMGKVVRELRMPTIRQRAAARSSAGGGGGGGGTTGEVDSSSAYASSAGFLARPEFALDPSTKYAVLSEGFGWRNTPGWDAHPASGSSSSSSSSRAFLYDLSRHADPVQALQGHAGPVLSVDWHPSADIIATASVDHTARIATLQNTTTHDELMRG